MTNRSPAGLYVENYGNTEEVSLTLKESERPPGGSDLWADSWKLPTLAAKKKRDQRGIICSKETYSPFPLERLMLLNGTAVSFLQVSLGCSIDTRGKASLKTWAGKIDEQHQCHQPSGHEIQKICFCPAGSQPHLYIIIWNVIKQRLIRLCAGKRLQLALRGGKEDPNF